MGSQIGTSAMGMLGNVLGSFVGGPIGGMIGGMAGGIIGSLLFSRKAKPLVPDVQLMNSAYGKPIPIIWGTMRLPANMIWQTDITTHEHSVGGKGAGQSTYTYTQSGAFAFCEGPVTYRKLFLDGKLFYDATALFPEELTKYKFVIRPYPGDDQQVADPAMVYWVATHVIPGNSCPAYRGLAYMVFDQPELNHFGNRMPQATAIISTSVTKDTKFATFAHYTVMASAGFWNTTHVSWCPDWIRGVVYAIYRPLDFSQHVFDSRNWGLITFSMFTQQEIMARDFNGVFFDGGLLPTGMYGNTVDARDITCDPGGMIYLLTTDYLDAYILTVSPNTLIFTGDVMKAAPRNGAPYSCIFVSGFMGFDLVSVAGGSTALIVATWEGTGVFVANPLEGTISNAYPVQFQETPGHYLPVGWPAITYRLGNDDQMAGKIDIWILNAPAELQDPDNVKVWLYHDQIVGSDPSMNAEWGSIRLTRTFTPADFGLPGKFDAWNDNFPPDLAAVYYMADDSLIIQVGGLFTPAVLKWSSQSGIGWVRPNYSIGGAHFYSQTQLGILPIAYWDLLSVTNSFQDLNLSNGVNTVSPNTGAGGGDQPLNTRIESNSYGNFVIFQGFYTGQLKIAYLMRQTNNKVFVADIIRDICHRVGMTDDMLDLSLVDQQTDGYCVQEMKSAGSAIADLLHVYQIDMVESDYTLKFIPRGQADAAVIPESDLASLDANDPSQYWKVKEAQQQEMPMILVVRFQDPDLDFQSGASYSKRTELPISTVWSKRRMTIDLPVIANNLEASQIAEKWLYTMWAERDTVETVLPWKYLYLDPADNIQVLMDNGDFFEVRIEEQNIGADLHMHINAAFEDNTVYNPTPTMKGASYGFIPQTVTQAPFADFLQFNVPLLQDQDDTGGVSSRIYYAVGATSGGWVTGEIFRSTDNSATWQDYQNIPFAANWGTSTTALGNTASKFSTDWINTVTVQMQPGAAFLQSCTYDDMLSGANGALLGQEVIQYQTVTLNADGTWTLSNLLRGRRGTEWATGVHGTGERFIMLQTGHIGGNTLSLSEINVQELWKLVPSGRFIDQAPTDAFTYRGFDLMPYAPVWIRRGVVAGPGMPITWVRRTRLGNVLMDSTDTAPLYESSELYNAYILPGPAAIATFNPGNPASYTRSFMGLTTPTCTYTSGQMTTDSFYPATSTLYIAVYQVSGVVGMGFQGYAVLPAF